MSPGQDRGLVSPLLLLSPTSSSVGQSPTISQDAISMSGSSLLPALAHTTRHFVTRSSDTSVATASPAIVFRKLTQAAMDMMNSQNLTLANSSHEISNRGHILGTNNETNPALVDLGIDTAQPLFTTDKMTISAVYFALAITAIASNFIVCFIVLGSQRMRTPTNYFIVNMAVGDIMMALLCIPFTVLANFIFQYWPFGLPLCRLVSYAQALSVFTSAYTLVAISIDKYFAIVYPMRLRMSKNQAKTIMLVIWLAALITSLPIAILSHLENDTFSIPVARTHQSSIAPSSSAPSSTMTLISTTPMPPMLTNQQRKRSIQITPPAKILHQQEHSNSRHKEELHDATAITKTTENGGLHHHSSNNNRNHKATSNSGGKINNNNNNNLISRAHNRRLRATEYHLHSNDVHPLNHHHSRQSSPAPSSHHGQYHSHQHSERHSHNNNNNNLDHHYSAHDNPKRTAESWDMVDSINNNHEQPLGRSKQGAVADVTGASKIIFNITNSMPATTTTSAAAAVDSRVTAQSYRQADAYELNAESMIDSSISSKVVGDSASVIGNAGIVASQQQQPASSSSVSSSHQPQQNNQQQHHQQPDSGQRASETYIGSTPESEKLYCHENWSFWPQGRYYYSTTLMILQFVIPLFVLVITYSRIVIIVWGKKMPGEEDDVRDARMARSKRKMIKMVIFCVIAYLLAWLPFNLFIMIGDFYPVIYEFAYTEKIFMCCHFLAMCHTITNPIIYIWMNNRFRAGFKEALLLALRLLYRCCAYLLCHLCLFGCLFACSRQKYLSLAERYDRSRAGRAFEHAYHHSRYMGRSGSLTQRQQSGGGATTTANALPNSGAPSTTNTLTHNTNYHHHQHNHSLSSQAQSISLSKSLIISQNNSNKNNNNKHELGARKSKSCRNQANAAQELATTNLMMDGHKKRDNNNQDDDNKTSKERKSRPAKDGQSRGYEPTGNSNATAFPLMVANNNDSQHLSSVSSSSSSSLNAALEGGALELLAKPLHQAQSTSGASRQNRVVVVHVDDHKQVEREVKQIAANGRAAQSILN